MNVRVIEEFKYLRLENMSMPLKYIFLIFFSYEEEKLVLYALNIQCSNSLCKADFALQHVTILSSVRGLATTERTDIKVCVWKPSTSV
jgi:hypothetical protein